MNAVDTALKMFTAMECYFDELEQNLRKRYRTYEKSR